MPLQNLLMFAVVLALVAVFLVFRERIVGAFKRFDQRNQARRVEEARALFDGYAHYRQTVELAEEQVEEVTKFRTTDVRTGEPAEAYVFLGVHYATRREAETVRHAAIIEKAREFYMELDQIYLGRRGSKEYYGGFAALTDDTKREKVKPPRP